MKKIFSFLLVSLLTLTSFAQDPTTLKHSATSYVDDYAGMFTPDQAQSLDRVIRSFKDTVQISLVTINSLNGLEPYEYATKLGNQWGVGSHSNNGLLILICPSAHQFWAATGRGIQGDLTDARCGSLYREFAKPLYKEGKFYEGTLAVMNKYIDILSPSAKEMRAKQEVAEAIYQRKQRDEMLTVVGWVIAGIVALIFIVIGVRSHRRKQAQKAAELAEVKHAFNVRAKDVDLLLKSFETDKEFVESQLLRDMFNAAGLGVGGSKVSPIDWTIDNYRDYIRRVDDFKVNSKKLIKELEEKKTAKAEKERQARIAEQRRSDTVEQAKSLLNEKTDQYYSRLNGMVSDAANSIPRLCFDKTNYNFKLDEYRNLVIRIQKAVERVNVLYNSTVTVENVGELIKAMSEVKSLETNFKLAGERFTSIFNEDKQKIATAQNGRSSLEMQIAAYESYIGKKGTTERGNTSTKNKCNALRARLNEFNGLDVVQMYALYNLLFGQLNTLNDSKSENDAYEREEQRKRDEENRRLEAIAAEKRRKEKEEEDRKRRLREEEEEADRRRRNSYSSSSYDSSSSSSSSYSSSSSDSSSSFGGGSFDGGGGGGSW